MGRTIGAKDGKPRTRRPHDKVQRKLGRQREEQRARAKFLSNIGRSSTDEVSELKHPMSTSVIPDQEDFPNVGVSFNSVIEKTELKLPPTKGKSSSGTTDEEIGSFNSLTTSVDDRPMFDKKDVSKPTVNQAGQRLVPATQSQVGNPESNSCVAISFHQQFEMEPSDNYVVDLDEDTEASEQNGSIMIQYLKAI